MRVTANNETIKIAGAGPAGLTAAIVLARAGRKVMVYERAQEVGSRHAGDLEAVENWTTRSDLRAELAEWGVATNFDCAPIYCLTCFGPGFRTVARIEDREPIFYVASRGPHECSLDAGLLAQALAAGVKISFGQAARPEQVDIIATGLAQARMFALGYTFHTQAPDGCYVCFDDSLTPRVYSYMIFSAGYGTIGAGAPIAQPNMRQTLERVVAGFRAHVKFDMLTPRYFAGPGIFGLPQTAQQQGKLYVGEAAEMQDAFFSFGLRMSMTTGWLAAHSLLSQTDYDGLWQKRLRPMLNATVVNRYLQRRAGNFGYKLLIYYMRLYPHSGRALLARHYRPLWYTHLLWPLAHRSLRKEIQTTRPPPMPNQAEGH
jgi:flavin-dependent dehydrogenase